MLTARRSASLWCNFSVLKTGLDFRSERRKRPIRAGKINTKLHEEIGSGPECGKSRARSDHLDPFRIFKMEIGRGEEGRTWAGAPAGIGPARAEGASRGLRGARRAAGTTMQSCIRILKWPISNGGYPCYSVTLPKANRCPRSWPRSTAPRKDSEKSGFGSEKRAPVSEKEPLRDVPGPGEAGQYPCKFEPAKWWKGHDVTHLNKMILSLSLSLARTDGSRRPIAFSFKNNSQVHVQGQAGFLADAGVPDLSLKPRLRGLRRSPSAYLWVNNDKRTDGPSAVSEILPASPRRDRSRFEMAAHLYLTDVRRWFPFPGSCAASEIGHTTTSLPHNHNVHNFRRHTIACLQNNPHSGDPPRTISNIPHYTPHCTTQNEDSILHTYYAIKSTIPFTTSSNNIPIYYHPHNNKCTFSSSMSSILNKEFMCPVMMTLLL